MSCKKRASYRNIGTASVELLEQHFSPASRKQSHLKAMTTKTLFLNHKGKAKSLLSYNAHQDTFNLIE